MIDVGVIVRRETEFFLLGPPPNRATPREMSHLLGRLRRATDRLGELPVTAVGGQWDLDYRAWLSRLQAYERIVAAALPNNRRQDIAKTVTAPLLLGLYPGEDTQRTPDVATPFTLANQREVAIEFQEQIADQFWEDIKTQAKTVASGGGIGLIAILAGLAGIAWLTRE